MDVADLPAFPTNLKPVQPGHPRHPSHGRGKSHSAAQRRRRARAKHGKSLVAEHYAQLRALPAARRKANILNRQRRHERIAANRERQVRWRHERAERAKQAEVFAAGGLRPVFE